jgi:ubiquinone/menaquinone biosynthesis C-methylase UbiE
LLLTYVYDPDVLITTINRFSLLNLWFENLLVPKKLRREVLESLPDARGKRVLEFGGGVGSLTKHLAERVGSQGKIYAVELSNGNARILERRMRRLRHEHVEVIHDPHLINRVHPSVHSVDMAVGIGNLSYIQDVKKVLHEISLLMPEHGHICFAEYIDFFGFLPNPKWLSDPEGVRQIFEEAGFSVTVHVRKGLFWKYLLIQGIKEKSGVPYI